MAEQPVAGMSAGVEHQQMHHLVEHHREVEDREPDDQGGRNPDPPLGSPPGNCAAPEEQQELPTQNEEVKERPTLVEPPQLFRGHDRGQPGAQIAGLIGPVRTSPGSVFHVSRAWYFRGGGHGIRRLAGRPPTSGGPAN